MSGPLSDLIARQPAVTFYCPVCKQVSVAERDEDGTCICPRCKSMDTPKAREVR